MDHELEKYLQIVEQKLQSAMQDIRNIRSRMMESKHQSQKTTGQQFFDCLRNDEMIDAAMSSAGASKLQQCPHN